MCVVCILRCSCCAVSVFCGGTCIATWSYCEGFVFCSVYKVWCLFFMACVLCCAVLALCSLCVVRCVLVSYVPYDSILLVSVIGLRQSGSTVFTFSGPVVILPTCI